VLKELEEHMAAVRLLGGARADDETAGDTIVRYLEFFERVEHLRSVGVLPSNVLRRAFGPVLNAHLADPRFRRIIEQDASQYEEVLLLAKHLGRR
jgi:hypothetical protein